MVVGGDPVVAGGETTGLITGAAGGVTVAGVAGVTVTGVEEGTVTTAGVVVGKVASCSVVCLRLQRIVCISPEFAFSQLSFHSSLFFYFSLIISMIIRVHVKAYLRQRSGE